MAETTIIDKKSLLYEVEKQLEKYDKRKDVSRGFAVGIKLITAFLGAAVAVLLGWKSGNKAEWMTNVALLSGAFISAINSIDTFFSFSSRWTHYKDICTQLIFLAKDAEDDDFADLSILTNYKTRLNSIITEARKGEVELHKKRK